MSVATSLASLLEDQPQIQYLSSGKNNISMLKRRRSSTMSSWILKRPLTEPTLCCARSVGNGCISDALVFEMYNMPKTKSAPYAMTWWKRWSETHYPKTWSGKRRWGGGDIHVSWWCRWQECRCGEDGASKSGEKLPACYATEGYHCAAVQAFMRHASGQWCCVAQNSGPSLNIWRDPSSVAIGTCSVICQEWDCRTTCRVL